MILICQESLSISVNIFQNNSLCESVVSECEVFSVGMLIGSCMKKWLDDNMYCMQKCHLSALLFLCSTRNICFTETSKQAVSESLFKLTKDENIPPTVAGSDRS